MKRERTKNGADEPSGNLLLGDGFQGGEARLEVLADHAVHVNEQMERSSQSKGQGREWPR